MRNVSLLLLLIVTVLFSACKKTVDTVETATVSEYNPLQVGKYITYDLDSTVFINFGAKDTIIKYQVKYEVDAQITDNLGRPAYRIIRYIRKTPANAWTSDNTSMAILTDFSFEFVENNMRFLKLKGPIRDAYTWKGNSYIDTYSLNSTVKYLDDWDYTYDSTNVPLTFGAFTLDSTLKVDQCNDVIGTPSDPNSYHERNFGMEKYAKGIGMIYRDFLHVEYQPPTPGRGGYFQGYGVRLTMIDHN